MKPAPFIRHVPKTLDEALAILAEVAPQDGRVLAGGQSLVPIMAFRMARPAHLVDINEVAGLDTACGRRRQARRSARACATPPFTSRSSTARSARCSPPSSRHIAHYPIRMRGTFCGSLAHADPASEWCLAAATLDAELVAKSTRGDARHRGEGFLRRHHVDGAGGGRIAGRGAPAAAACRHQIRLQRIQPPRRRFRDGRVAGRSIASMAARSTDARVGVGGAEPSPRRIAEAEAALNGKAPGDDAFRAAAEAAAKAIDPLEDIQTSAEYRRDLVRAVVRRALEASRNNDARTTKGSGTTWVGRAIRRLEDPALVTGQGRFTADLPAAHWVRFVRSPRRRRHTSAKSRRRTARR